MIDIIAKILEDLGPAFGLAAIAFYFFQQQNKDSKATIASIVKDHRQDFMQTQSRSEKHFEKLQADFKDTINKIEERSDKRASRLEDALAKHHEEAKCRYDERKAS